MHRCNLLLHLSLFCFLLVSQRRASQVHTRKPIDEVGNEKSSGALHMRPPSKIGALADVHFSPRKRKCSGIPKNGQEVAFPLR